MILHIYCEGPTELDFSKEILIPFLKNNGITTTASICTTGYQGGVAHKGGVSKFSKIRSEISDIHRNPNLVITTMFDLYGLPKDTPGIGEYEDITQFEDRIASEIGCDRLIVNLIRHEFEALLFSDVNEFRSRFTDSAYHKLKTIRDKYDTPEDIDSFPSTSPSKRIYEIIPEFKKTLDGIDIAKGIGIDKMMAECPHFRSWIERILSYPGLKTA